jgi:hypothetical protein
MTTKRKWDEETSWDSIGGPSAGTAAARIEANERVTENARELARADERAKAFAAGVEAARMGLDKIPDPVAPETDDGLTPAEEERLKECVAGVDLLTTATWVAAKSLDTMAVGRLFRMLPHKTEPGRCYATIEEWAWVEKGIKQSRCSKLRAGWEIGEVLLARGYDIPEGQVREIVPVKNAHGLNAAIGVYELVVKAVGAKKVTAEQLREVVQLLPGDLALKDDDDPLIIAEALKGAVEKAEPSPPARPTIPTVVRRDVDRRAVALADQLNRGRIPRNEVLYHLLQAFADETDNRVYDVVLERMKQAAKK